jgi:4-diphosphocytidyl-2-C-methyl-D-erythritol kinase
VTVPVGTLPLHALAPAKINLGLFVGPTRADGRHELTTVMQSISLADELTLQAASDPDASEDVVVCPGLGDPPTPPTPPNPPNPPAENLAAVALAAFRAATGWDAPPLQLHIAKRVPVAAGLGGGSGDAAATLRLAAAASGLGDHDLLEEIARTLGADVPAQVHPGRWLARGAGEQLRALPDPVIPLGVLVLPNAHHLSTADVYAQADRMGLTRKRAELEDAHRALTDALADGSPLPPAELLGNDLEDAARTLCPEINAALLEARATDADAAVVSGSGPTVLGLFAGSRGPARARAATRALAERVPAPFAADAITAHFARVTLTADSLAR